MHRAPFADLQGNRAVVRSDIVVGADVDRSGCSGTIDYSNEPLSSEPVGRRRKERDMVHRDIRGKSTSARLRRNLRIPGLNAERTAAQEGCRYDCAGEHSRKLPCHFSSHLEC